METSIKAQELEDALDFLSYPVSKFNMFRCWVVVVLANKKTVQPHLNQYHPSEYGISEVNGITTVTFA